MLWTILAGGVYLRVAPAAAGLRRSIGGGFAVATTLTRTRVHARTRPIARAAIDALPPRRF
jgi:hypothetical protein